VLVNDLNVVGVARPEATASPAWYARSMPKPGDSPPRPSIRNERRTIASITP
jgi:hypothetical protein